MTVALRSPELVGALIPVDNAPIDAYLKSEFHKYVQGLREIEKARVKRQVEADDILKKYEEVSRSSRSSLPCFSTRLTSSGRSRSAVSPYQSCAVFRRTTFTASYPYQYPCYES